MRNTRARVKIATRAESDTQTGDRRVSFLLTRGNFHARSRISLAQLSQWKMRDYSYSRFTGKRGYSPVPVCSGFLDFSSSYPLLESLCTYKNVLLTNCARLRACLKEWKNFNTFKLILTAAIVQWDHHYLGVWRAFSTSHCNKELQHTVVLA